jgi:hypothetical protein
MSRISFKVISTVTSSYKLRKKLRERGQDGTSNFNLIAHSRKIRDSDGCDSGTSIFVFLLPCQTLKFLKTRASSSSTQQPGGKICCEEVATGERDDDDKNKSLFDSVFCNDINTLGSTVFLSGILEWGIIFVDGQ